MIDLVSLPLSPSSSSQQTQYITYTTHSEYDPPGLAEVQFDGINENGPFNSKNLGKWGLSMCASTHGTGDRVASFPDSPSYRNRPLNSRTQNERGRV